MAEDWQRRSITLIGDRATIDQHCADWASVGWQVIDVAEAPETVGTHACHTVTVLVPPLDWEGHLCSGDALLNAAS